ncbi:CAP domain-containing protein [Streptomyces sp. NBC_01341]|uniref:CAP domain-containing protein n=1 Tax=Streptomyces sp. NBC_01341 TaxID=2903831 RepID=UPI002E123A84|nr:CAP domain-containing protein [Streptomyces sp. NBC_01341]
MPKKQRQRRKASPHTPAPRKRAVLPQLPGPQVESADEEWDSQWDDGPGLRFIVGQDPSGPGAASVAPGGARLQRNLESSVVALVNQERRRHGLPLLKEDARLRSSARAHSEDMARRGFFAHLSPDGSSPADRMTRHAHPRPGGENIAMGQQQAAAVMVAWMNSPGHRANILHGDFGSIGVGVHIGSPGHWWTQNFGY